MRRVRPFSVALRPVQVERLRALETRLQQTRSELVRVAIEDLLSRYEHPVKERRAAVDQGERAAAGTAVMVAGD